MFCCHQWEEIMGSKRRSCWYSVPGSNYLSKELASAKNKFTSNMSRRLGSSSASSREKEDSWNKKRAYLFQPWLGLVALEPHRGMGRKVEQQQSITGKRKCMYLACHGCCGQGNAGFGTCMGAGACRKCCCLARQVSKDAYPGTWELSSTSVFPATAVNSKEGKGISPPWGQICCEHFRNSIGRNWRMGSEGWKGQYQTSKCHFLSFLASVENWSLFLFLCFLLYLYHLSYLNSIAQGRVQRRWSQTLPGGTQWKEGQQ